MRKTFLPAVAIALLASTAIAGDAGEDVIRLGPPQDNDAFAASSTPPAPEVAPASTGRHGNPAALAVRMFGPTPDARAVASAAAN